MKVCLTTSKIATSDKFHTVDKITTRPSRNRKNSRKSWTHNGDSDRPVKRLFTPEIKKLLKDWLVRRRDNPYPSRDEKKALAIETGLTYTQICNWFANWRRKLKNTSNQKKSWGNLIKNYNFSARGNVEQFSICSSDSIWGENEMQSLGSETASPSNHESDSEPQAYSHFDEKQRYMIAHGQNFMIPLATSSSSFSQPPNSSFSGFMTQAKAQCFQVSSTSNEFPFQNHFTTHQQQKQYFANSNKFKNHIIEKYFRGLDDESNNNHVNTNNIDQNSDSNINDNQTSISTQDTPEKPPSLSKWLISTANFKPSNYNIDFMKNFDRKLSNKACSLNQKEINEKELIAAETLVLLKNNFRTKFYNS